MFQGTVLTIVASLGQLLTKELNILAQSHTFEQLCLFKS
jgi:hypothetical protein